MVTLVNDHGGIPQYAPMDEVMRKLGEAIDTHIAQAICRAPGRK